MLTWTGSFQVIYKTLKLNRINEFKNFFIGREAVELVRDAFEFCDGTSFIFDDGRSSNKVTKSSNQEKASSSVRSSISQLIDQQTKSSINSNRNVSFADQQPKLNTIKETTNFDIDKSIIYDDVSAPALNAAISYQDYVPKFTEIQRKQLDEQLRNVKLSSSSSSSWFKLYFYCLNFNLACSIANAVLFGLFLYE
jgi:hypothetical protein